MKLQERNLKTKTIEELVDIILTQNELIDILQNTLKGGSDFLFDSSLGLTLSEGTILKALYKNYPKVVYKEHLYQALYALKIDKDPSDKLISVFISKARIKLKSLGIDVQAKRGSGGYFLDKNSFDLLTPFALGLR